MLFLTRHRRRWVAGLAVAALAFAHVAVAAHGCLQNKMPEPQIDCDEHHRDAPNELLCRVHFQAETQTLDLSKLPQLSAFNTPVLVFALERMATPAAKEIALALRMSVSSAPPPPLAILYSRFLV